MAKSTVVGNMSVVIDVDASGIKKGIDQAQSGLTRFGKAANDNVTSGMRGMSSQLGAVGAGINALGLAGISAGAGLAAFGAAMVQTRAALNFVDELGDTAAKLHVNVEALQEWRFAAQEAGLEAKDFDTSIQGLQSSVGKLVTGIGSGRVKAAFDAIGITREQAMSYKNVEEMLPLISDRLRELGSVAERVAIAEKLGISDLLPLLDQGADKIAEMTKKARDLGIVIDEKTVASMGDLQRSVEVASQAIDINLKQAFLGLAPTLVTITELTAKLTNKLSTFMSTMGEIGKRSTQQIKDYKAILEAAAKKDAFANVVSSSRTREIAALNDELIRRGEYSTGAGTGQRGQARRSRDARAAADAEAAGSRRAAALDSPGGSPSGGGSSRSSSRSSTSSPGLQWNSQTSTLAEINPATTGQDWSEEISATIKAKDWGPVFADMNTAIADNSLGGLVAGINAAQAATRDAFATSIRGGLEAGMRGGIPGIMEYLANSLKTKLLDGLANSIANMLSGAGGGGSAGGKVGTFATIAKFGAKIFGIPGFASGTSYAPGGLAMVGERGPELVNLPRGSRVNPAGSASAMGGTVVQHFHVNAAGAIMAADIRNEMQVIGIRSAMAGAQGGAMKAKQDMQRSGWDRFA